MDLKVIENGLQNRFRIEHWSRGNTQMLEALEHPLGSPRIFEAKERGECFALKSNLGTSLWHAKGGWGAQHSPHWGALDFSNFRFWHFRFSILTFSIFDFDMSILVARIAIWTLFYIIRMRLTHLDMCFCLISVLNVTNFGIWKKTIFIFHISARLLQIFIVSFKIKSVEWKFVIIAKMYLKDIEKWSAK